MIISGPSTINGYSLGVISAYVEKESSGARIVNGKYKDTFTYRVSFDVFGEGAKLFLMSLRNDPVELSIFSECGMVSSVFREGFLYSIPSQFDTSGKFTLAFKSFVKLSLKDVRK